MPPMRPPALSGTRVVEWTTHFPAAMAAMHLADMGAEVVTVIGPDDGDRDRREPGYLAWDRNKTRVHLDRQRSAHRAAFDALVAHADVAILDAPRDQLRRRGLDGATLTQAHPHLVYAWAPAYGAHGRLSSTPPAHGILTALTGIADNQASYAGVPVHLVSQQAYYGQANCLAIDIVAALFERTRSGRGQEVVAGGLHGAAQTLATTRFGEARLNIMGAPLGGAPNYRLYRCADGEWFFLGALFEALYLQTLEITGVLGEVLATPGIDGDLRAAMVPPGSASTMHLLEEAFRSRPRDEWLARLRAADIPSGPVRTREDWFGGETVAANDMRVELEHPELGTVRMPGVSLQLSHTPARRPRLATRAPAPPEWSTDAAPRTTPATPSSDAPPTAAPPTDAPPTAAPLDGVRVLDLGVVIAGAYAGSILAGLGADVVKVETPSGDPFRSYGPTFSSYNRGKRSLVLDLKKADAKALFLELVARADVVLDNYRLGVRERLGITYEDLCAVNPQIISLSITGYGTVGPQASEPGYDPLLQAQSGLMHAQGGPGDEPVFGFIAVNDVGSAAMAAFGIVTALLARERTGQGQEITTSLAAQSVLLQAGELTTHPDAPAPAVGARDCPGVGATERFYECTDGWIAVACRHADHAAALLAALGVTDVDPATGLSADRDGDLATRLVQAIAPSTVAQVLARLEDAGVPAAPVLTVVDTLTDPYLQANDFYEPYVDRAYGTGVAVRFFGDFERSRTGHARPAPALGEHTTEVLLELGLAPERIADLFANGSIA